MDAMQNCMIIDEFVKLHQVWKIGSIWKLDKI